MKTNPLRVSSAISKTAVACAATSLLLGATAPAWAVAPIEVGYDLIEFINPDLDVPDDFTDDIGFDAALGDTADYEDVFPGVDARVTVVDITNLENEVDKIDEGQDETDPDFDDTPIWVEVDPPGVDNQDANGGPGSATFQVDFFVAGGTFTTPVTLNEVGITVKDIDGKQFVTFEDVTSYNVSSDPVSILEITESGSDVTFAETQGDNSFATEEQHWTSVRYAATDSITVTVGSEWASDAEFALLFTLPEWSVDPVEVVLDEPAVDEEELASTGPGTEIALWGALGLAFAVAGATASRLVTRRVRS